MSALAQTGRQMPAILLLEDEPLILMDLEFAAEDAGCRPLCASSVAEALDYVRDETIYAAVLDVSLRDEESCVPVAHALSRRGVPFILHSGDLNRKDEPVRALRAELVAKPASADEVIRRAMAQAARA